MKSTILLIIILFIVSCEKDEKASYSKNLIGNWEGVKENDSYIITSNISQPVTIPYKTGTGSIELNGAEEASLKYIYLFSTNGVLQIAIAEEAFGVPSEDTNFVLNIYDYGDFGTFCQLTKTSGDADEIYEGQLEFTVNGLEITVLSGALYNDFVNDSVTVTGTLSAIQENVSAGTTQEIGNVDWVFRSYEVSFLINDDKSFQQTIKTIDSETLENSGTWDATSDEITFHFTNYSETFEYNITNSGLELTFINDLCLLNPDECLPRYELMYGMESGSLERVDLKKTTFFNKSSN